MDYQLNETQKLIQRSFKSFVDAQYNTGFE